MGGHKAHPSRLALARTQRRLLAGAGFTLVELLVVVAILSVLFTLLFVPLMKSFGYIHTSNVRIGVQNSVRMIFEAITREIADATYIYDNIDDPLQCSLVMVLPQGVGGNANVRLPGDTTAPPTNVPILLLPGPGLDYNVTTPLHVHYGLFLSKALSPSGQLLPYSNEFELDNADLRGAGPPVPAGALTLSDNLYRIFRAEYYPYQESGVSADPRAARFLLPAVLGGATPLVGWFREPGELVDDSLYLRKRGSPILVNSQTVANRRQLLEESGLVVGLSPREDVDAAWATFTPQGQGAWAVKPGFRIEGLQVRNETLEAVITGGAPYPSTYRADYGHWQSVRRKAWAYMGSQQPQPWWRFFQTFDVQVAQRYNSSDGSRQREYYVSIGRPDSTPSTEPFDANDPANSVPGNPLRFTYYVWRKSNPSAADPIDGPWPQADVPVFNLTRYQQRIARWRQGPGPNDTPNSFWDQFNPYDPALLPSDPNEPYWPEMAFTIDVSRGVVEYLIDPPVREPKRHNGQDQPQPPGPLAPFQVPYSDPGDPEYIPPPDGNTSDWLIPDVLRARYSARFGNQDPNAEGGPTTWIRIPASTVRVMVGQPRVPGDPSQGYIWKSYVRASQRTLLNAGEFCFDEMTGLLSFDPDETGNWTPETKIRAWYQIQTNVQRRNDNEDMDSTNGHTVTASYCTKEVLKVLVGLRAYDTGSGRAASFQLTATVRPRNLR